MSNISRILSICLSLSLIFSIIELVRRNRLKEKYALVWLLTGISMFILVVFHNLLNWLTIILGIVMPVNTVFFLGIFFIIIINIHFSIVISNLSEQNKKLAQKLTLLEAEIKKI